MLLNMTLHVTLVSSAGHCFDTEPVGQLCINVHQLRLELLRGNRSILIVLCICNHFRVV